MPRVAAEIVHFRKHLMFGVLPKPRESFDEQPARFVWLLNGFVKSGMIRGQRGF